LPSVRDPALGKAGIFLKKTLNIFAESQTDKALGKDYTLPSANPSTLGKGIFFKKNFSISFPFSLTVFPNLFQYTLKIPCQIHSTMQI